MSERQTTLESVLYELEKDRKVSDEEGAEAADKYQDILSKVIELISINHAGDFASVLYDEKAETVLKNLINRYLVSEKLISEKYDFTSLTNRIYEDMAGISFIQKYLTDPDVEEININGPYGTWVVTPNEKKLTNERFYTSAEAINIITKASRMGNVILDEASPFGDSYLRKGIRISAAINPVVDEGIGAIASIRKQKPSFITKEKLIEFGTATEDILDLLTIFINNHISIALVGGTGSGKTADMNYLLSTIPNDVRIYSIEDTKELLLEKFDETGRKINDVVQVYTNESAQNPVTMNDLLRIALRFHPEIIVPAEMRGAEAVTAVEAGRTGHTIVSSFHANSARDGYDRILTMYEEGNNSLSEERILKLIISAFPIMIFKKQMRDHSRKYVEIFEATDVKDGKVVGQTIYRYKVTGVERESLPNGRKGRIMKILGHHELVDGISESLTERLLLEGIEIEELQRFIKKDG